jgi:hypothetical protein
MKALSFIFCILFGTALFAQIQGPVNLKHLGISFNIPEGWVGQQNENGMMMGSYTEPGIVIFSISEYHSIEGLMEELRKGLLDDNGTNLQLSKPPIKIQDNVYQVEFAGKIEWQEAKGHGIVHLNNLGKDPSFLYITSPAQFTDQNKQIIHKIYNSLKLFKPEGEDYEKQWREFLSNVRLTYLDSYYSGPSTTGGAYIGGSSKTEIDLCVQGYFFFNSSSQVSGGSASSSLGSSGGKNGQGQWSIDLGISGNPTLSLKFHNGEVWEYLITQKDNTGEVLYLNDKKYFRTRGGQYSARCN